VKWLIGLVAVAIIVLGLVLLVIVSRLRALKPERTRLDLLRATLNKTEDTSP
jgi:hypothetical protein